MTVPGGRAQAGAWSVARQVLKKLFCYMCAYLVLGGAGLSEAANRVHARFERIVHSQFDAERMSLELLPAVADAPAMLRLRAERLRIEALNRNLRDVEFDCEPQIVDGPAAVTTTPVEPDAATITPTAPPPWQCEGPLRWRGGSGDWRLSWRADEALTQARIRLGQGRSEIEVTLPLGDDPLVIAARRMHATWLQAVLPQLAWQQGRIDARMTLADGDASTTRWRGEVDVSGLAAEVAGGALALAGIALTGPVEVRSRADGGLAIAATPTLTAGEVLAGSVYLAWPSGSAVALDVAAEQRGELWRLDRLKLRDAGVAIDASASVQASADDWLRSLNATFEIDLATRYERYLEGAMASLGQAGLQASGTVAGSIELGIGGEVQAFDAQFGNVDLRHPAGRYALTGLDGPLAFRRGDVAPVPIELRWRGLSVHALQFDPGVLRAVTQQGEIRATEALSLGLFGGDLVASDLTYRPLAATEDRLQASLRLSGIDIAALVAAFDWPAFTGRLDGTLPGLRYAGDTLSAEGEIKVQVFDGEVRVARLAIERPFGVAPAFAGEIALDNLDLQPMTEVFGLGRIEGRLNGAVAGLRLLDWRPTAFDARLHTAEKGRRRISQLAVEQLTQIGGGGGAAGVQGRLIGMFDSFGYRRIGLSCRLANNVCEMGGIDESGGGYTILQGSGLPLITIRGFQKRVDWPVLVGRLQSIAGGQAPIVE